MTGFKPRIPLSADVGEKCYFLTAQTGRAATAAGGDTDLFRRDRFPPFSKKAP
jgi:hypothetical protein